MAKFLFDIDECLMTGDVVLQASREFLAEGKINRFFTNADLTSWYFDGVPKCVGERCLELFKEEWWIVDSKVPVPGSQLLVHTLLSLGHEVAALTARDQSLKEATIKNMEKHFPGIDNVVISESSESKLVDLAKLKPDFYFDDHAGFCEEARLMGAKTFLISNSQTGWNNKIAIHNDITPLESVSYVPWEIITDLYIDC